MDFINQLHQAIVSLFNEGPEANHDLYVFYNGHGDSHHPDRNVLEIAFRNKEQAEFFSKELFKKGIKSLNNTDTSGAPLAKKAQKNNDIDTYGIFLSPDEIGNFFLECHLPVPTIEIKKYLSFYCGVNVTLNEKTKNLLKLIEEKKGVLKTVRPPITIENGVLKHEKPNEYTYYWLNQFIDPTTYRSGFKAHFNDETSATRTTEVKNLAVVGKTFYKGNCLTGEVYEYTNHNRKKEYFHLLKSPVTNASTNLGAMNFFDNAGVLYFWNYKYCNKKNGRLIFFNNSYSRLGPWILDEAVPPMTKEKAKEHFTLILDTKINGQAKLRQAVPIESIHTFNQTAVEKFEANGEIIDWNESLFGLPKGAPEGFGFRDQSLLSRFNTLFVMYLYKEQFNLEDDLPILNCEMKKKQRPYFHEERLLDVLQTLDRGSLTLAHNNFKLLGQIIKSAQKELGNGHPLVLEAVEWCKKKNVLPELFLQKVEIKRWDQDEAYREEIFLSYYQANGMRELFNNSVNNIEENVARLAVKNELTNPVANAELIKYFLEKERYDLVCMVAKCPINTPIIDEKEFISHLKNAASKNVSKFEIEAVFKIYKSDMSNFDKIKYLYENQIEEFIQPLLKDYFNRRDLVIGLLKQYKESLMPLDKTKLEVLENFYSLIFARWNDQKDTLLHFALRTNDVELVQHLLHNGASLTANENIDKKTPLHFVLQSGMSEQVRILESHPDVTAIEVPKGLIESLTRDGQTHFDYLLNLWIHHLDQYDKFTKARKFFVHQQAPVNISLDLVTYQGISYVSKLIDLLSPKQIAMYPLSSKRSALKELLTGDKDQLQSIAKLIPAIETFEEFQPEEKDNLLRFAITYYDEKYSDTILRLLFEKDFKYDVNDAFCYIIEVHQDKEIINQLIQLFLDVAVWNLNETSLRKVLTPQFIAECQDEEMIQLILRNQWKYFSKNQIQFLKQMLLVDNFTFAKEFLLKLNQDKKIIILEQELNEDQYLIYLALLTKNHEIMNEVIANYENKLSVENLGDNNTDLLNKLIEADCCEGALTFIQTCKKLEPYPLPALSEIKIIKYLEKENAGSALAIAYERHDLKLFEFLCAQIASLLNFDILDKLIKDRAFTYIDSMVRYAIFDLNESQKYKLLLLYIKEKKLQNAKEIADSIRVEASIDNEYCVSNILHCLVQENINDPLQLVLLEKLLTYDQFKMHISGVDSEKMSPIQYALKSNQLKLIEILIKQAACHASQNDLIAVLEHYQNQGLGVPEDLLQAMAKQGEMLDILLRYAATKPELSNSCDFFIKKGALLFRKDANGVSALDVMLENKNIDALTSLAKHIAHDASEEDFDAVFKMFIDGKKINEALVFISTRQFSEKNNLNAAFYIKQVLQKINITDFSHIESFKTLSNDISKLDTKIDDQFLLESILSDKNIELANFVLDHAKNLSDKHLTACLLFAFDEWKQTSSPNHYTLINKILTRPGFQLDVKAANDKNLLMDCVYHIAFNDVKLDLLLRLLEVEGLVFFNDKIDEKTKGKFQSSISNLINCDEINAQDLVLMLEKHERVMPLVPSPILSKLLERYIALIENEAASQEAKEILIMTNKLCQHINVEKIIHDDKPIFKWFILEATKKKNTAEEIRLTWNMLQVLLAASNHLSPDNEIKKILKDRPVFTASLGYEWLRWAIKENNVKAIRWLASHQIYADGNIPFAEHGQSYANLFEYAIHLAKTNKKFSTLQALIQLTPFNGSSFPLDLFTQAGELLCKNNMSMKKGNGKMCRFGSFEQECAFYLPFIVKSIEAAKTVDAVLALKDQLMKSYDFIFAAHGINFKNHHLADKEMSKVGSKIIKMLKLKILDIYDKNNDMLYLSEDAKAFLGDDRKSSMNAIITKTNIKALDFLKPKTNSLQIYSIFPVDRQKARIELRASMEKVKESLPKFAPGVKVKF